MGYIILALFGGFVLGMVAGEEMHKKSILEEEEFWKKEREIMKEIWSSRKI